MHGTQPFVLNLGNAKVVTGEVRYTELGDYAYIFIIIVTLMLALPANYFLIRTTLHTWEQWGYLEQTGVETRATVVSWYERSSDNRSTYYVTYRFQYVPPDGDPRWQTGESLIDAASYRRLEQGMRIAVYYVPTNPTISRVASEMHSPMNNTVGVVLLLVFTNGAALFALIMGTMCWRRDRHLARNGRRLVGELQGCKGDLDSDNDLRVTVEYTFQSPTSKVIHDQSSAYRNDLQGQPLPEAGTPVWVLYADDHTYKLL